MKNIISVTVFTLYLIATVNATNAAIDISELKLSNLLEKDSGNFISTTRNNTVDLRLEVLETQFSTLLKNQTLPPSGFLSDRDILLYYEIVENNDTCTIVKFTHEGRSWFKVIAWLFKEFLPDAIYEICIRAGGDKDVCDVVYYATLALIELSGGSQNGATRGVNWKVSKTSTTGTAEITLNSIDRAYAAQAVFAAYRDKCSSGVSVPWRSITINEGYNNESYQKTKIYNSKLRSVHIDYSSNGSTWKCLDFDAYETYTFDSNIRYIKVITGDNYKIEEIIPGRQYTIVWCSEHSANELR